MQLRLRCEGPKAEACGDDYSRQQHANGALGITAELENGVHDNLLDLICESRVIAVFEGSDAGAGRKVATKSTLPASRGD
jgi:hypothetical protein